MAEDIDGRVREAVDAWLRWLPRWSIGTSRARTRVCRVCFGSPVATAAGFDHEVPHAVQHALLNRLRVVVDDAVDVYTTRNLPLVDRELRRAERPGDQGYQPQEGLELEFQGLDLDPEPEPGQPFLFTLAELTGAPTDDARQRPPAQPPTPTEYSDEAKAALRRELELADEHARSVGTAVCFALLEQRTRIADAVGRLVEPQVEALLAELSQTLDVPGAP